MQYGKSKIKGGTIITNLPNSGFDNGIHQTDQTVQSGASIGKAVHFQKEQGKKILAEKGSCEADLAQPQAPMFKKSIGNTLYTVSVHFSHTSKESFEDKILKMLESAVI